MQYSIDENHCWIWQGQTTNSGYGFIGFPNGRSQMAHRWMYERLVEQIPDGLEIDHLRRNKSCVNPAHLEPVTHAENMRRAKPFRNTPDTCKLGHLLDLSLIHI